MRLKFAAASATGRTRCGEFVDQKDERKPIAHDQRPETSGGKTFLLPNSYFCFSLRYAQIDFVFASSRREMSNALLSLPAVVGEKLSEFRRDPISFVILMDGYDLRCILKCKS